MVFYLSTMTKQTFLIVLHPSYCIHYLDGYPRSALEAVLCFLGSPAPARLEVDGENTVYGSFWFSAANASPTLCRIETVGTTNVSDL
jgi:hypothetical protein